MGELTTNVIGEEELKKKLVSIYGELQNGVTKKAIMKKYEISNGVLDDLSEMTQLEFNEFIEKIPNIKEEIQSGKKNSKIALDFPCTSKTIYFVGKQLLNNYDRILKENTIEEETRKEYKRAEEMWKKFMSGVSIEDLSYIYNDGAVEETRYILNNFQNLLDNERPAFDSNIERRRIAINNRYGFDKDTIDYILYGNKANEIISVEECIEKLTSLYKDITEKPKTFEYLKRNYQVTPALVSELRRMPEEKFNKFLDEIPYIKGRIKGNEQEKRITSKIGFEIGYAGKLVSYVAKNISEDYANRRNKTESLTKPEDVALEEP